MSTDYLRNVARDLKDAGVDLITPDQLDELAYFIDASQVERVLHNIAEPDSFDRDGNYIEPTED